MKRVHVWLALAALCLGCSDDAAKNTGSSPPPGNVAPGAGGAPPGGPPMGGPPGGAAAGGGASPSPIPDQLTPAPIDGGVVTLSPENTRIEFVCAHAPPAQPDPRLGGFEKLSGKAEVDPDSQALQSVSVEIDTKSVWAQMGMGLTNHLKNADFFDVNEIPTASFQSTKITVEDAASGKATVDGDLTLHGVTKPVTIPATIKVTDEGLTLAGQFQIDRTEFGMNFDPNRVEKLVALTVVIGAKTEVKGMGGGPGGPGGRPGGPGGPGGRPGGGPGGSG